MPTPEAAAVGPTTSPTPVTTTAEPTPVVARINGLTITRGELDDALYRAYGINLLADLVELDLAKQALGQKGMSLDEADVTAERQQTFAKMFVEATPDEYPKYFDQLKHREHFTDAEFDLKMQTTAALRKLARPQMVGQIPDSYVYRAFEQLYGENRRIADITLGNMADAAEAQQRLGHEPFDAVAKDMSLDKRTAAVGGVWPPFSTRTPAVPPSIRDAAFSLKVGGVSDALSDGPRYHLIKLLAVIPPKVVKFEAVKDDVRRQLEEQWMDSAIKQLRDSLGQVALARLDIVNPTLKQRWDAMIDAQRPRGGTLNSADASAQIGRAERPPATRPAG